MLGLLGFNSCDSDKSLDITFVSLAGYRVRISSSYDVQNIEQRRFDIVEAVKKRLKPNISVARLESLRCRLQVFDDVLLAVILNLEGQPFKENVVNYVINGRCYVFKNSLAGLEPLSFPGVNYHLSYREIVVSPIEGRKNVIRNPKGYPAELIMKLCDVHSEHPVVVDGDAIKGSNLKLKTFKLKGLSCADCGIKGTIFFKERDDHTQKWGLNLYAIDKRGKFILMTRDHIVPVAKGGRNHINNSQTMCADCNNKKGSKYERR
jgi:hypothetical protein